MTENERPIFDRALDTLTTEFRVSILPAYVKDQYWQVLKSLSGPQFMDVCGKLSSSFVKKWSDDFPLPAQFLEAVPNSVSREPFKPRRQEPMTGDQQVHHIIRGLLSLMPPPGKFNTDEEAEAMVREMDSIVDAAFKNSPPTPFVCPQCQDSGFVWVWMQFQPGLHWDGSEVASKRVTGSPCWISEVGCPDPPMPDIRPTTSPVIARCVCPTGHTKTEKLPFCDSFASSG